METAWRCAVAGQGDEAAVRAFGSRGGLQIVRGKNVRNGQIVPARLREFK